MTKKPKCPKYIKRNTLGEGRVNDIAASEDILGEIILYNTLSANIFVYFIMSALYFINIIFWKDTSQVGPV